MAVVLRRATSDDARFVWEVNNHPDVRARSISTNDIPWPEHQRWFERKLSDPKALILIGIRDGQPAAVVRFDIQNGDATIGVAVHPTVQARGLGSEVIARGTSELSGRSDVSRAIAWIRPDNVPSIKAFTRAGYVRVGSGQQAGITLERFECSVAR